MKNNVINQFRGKYYFLSNFYYSPFNFFNFEFKTVEHFYQALKATNINDFIKIVLTKTPKEAKQIGNNIKLRDNWNSIKDEIMFIGVYYKFKNNINLKNRLLHTNNAILIEENTWHDNYWGNCICDKCKNKNGLNKLGKILMNVRELIKNNKVYTIKKEYLNNISNIINYSEVNV